MIEKIKIYLNIYQQLIEKFVEKEQLSIQQKDIIFKSLATQIDISVLSEFETLNQVEIPIEYKRFLTEIGNGTGDTWESAGIGPDLGILKVIFHKDQCLILGDILIDLQTPFPFADAYNLENWEELAEQFSQWLEKYNTEFRDKLFQRIEPTTEEFERFIQHHGENPRDQYYENFELNGILPICGIGCGEYYFLVITGPSKGEIWIDSRDLWGGIAPVLDESGSRQKFDSWYFNWLKAEVLYLQNKLKI